MFVVESYPLAVFFCVITMFCWGSIGELPSHKEGFENCEWILLDYFDVVVHIFEAEARDFYQLEKLWADAPREDVKPVEQPSKTAAKPVAKPVVKRVSKKK